MKPSDDLDGLLRTFFRNEMPHPWPAPRLPRFAATLPLRRSFGRSLIRSRWALAASVALLLLASLLLPSRFTQDPNPAGSLGGSGISTGTRHDFDRERKIKEFEKKYQPRPKIEDDGQIRPDESDLVPLK